MLGLLSLPCFTCDNEIACKMSPSRSMSLLVLREEEINFSSPQPQTFTSKTNGRGPIRIPRLCKQLKSDSRRDESHEPTWLKKPFLLHLHYSPIPCAIFNTFYRTKVQMRDDSDEFWHNSKKSAVIISSQCFCSNK